MSRHQRALVLWAVFGLALFAVVFDWQTRLAGFEFIAAQRAGIAQGRPLDTIEHGFRPLVGAAARRASLWGLLAFGIGAGAIAASVRQS